MHQHSASKMKSTDTSQRDAVYEIDESYDRTETRERERGRYSEQLVGLSVCHKFQEQDLSLPCSFCGICFGR